MIGMWDYMHTETPFHGADEDKISRVDLPNETQGKADDPHFTALVVIVQNLDPARNRDEDCSCGGLQTFIMKSL